MKKFFLLLFLVMTFWIISIPKVSAQKDELNKEKYRVTNATKSSGMKEKIDEKRKELISRFYKRMLNRIEAAILRLEKLIARIENRVIKIKETGTDTVNIEAQMAEVKEKLKRTRKELEKLKSDEITFVESSQPKVEFAQVKQRVGLLRDEVKGVHQALVQIVTQIKGLHK